MRLFPLLWCDDVINEPHFSRWGLRNIFIYSRHGGIRFLINSLNRNEFVLFILYLILIKFFLCVWWFNFEKKILSKNHSIVNFSSFILWMIIYITSLWYSWIPSIVIMGWFRYLCISCFIKKFRNMHRGIQCTLYFRLYCDLPIYLIVKTWGV